MTLQGIKHIMVAAALTVVTAMAGQAQAFTFTDGDLVLAIYGNNSEALYNVGNYSSRLASGASFSLDASAGLTAASAGTNPVKWTIFGWDTSLPTGQVHAATKSDPSAITGLLGLTNQFNPIANWSFVQLNHADVIPKADEDSFFNRINSSGDGKLNGAWPVPMEGAVGDTLNILRGDVQGGTFTQVGRVQLAANGQLTIGNPGPGGAPVPLPAGVVLFGTGVIALVGLARRSFNWTVVSARTV